MPPVGPGEPGPEPPGPDQGQGVDQDQDQRQGQRRGRRDQPGHHRQADALLPVGRVVEGDAVSHLLIGEGVEGQPVHEPSYPELSSWTVGRPGRSAGPRTGRRRPRTPTGPRRWRPAAAPRTPARPRPSGRPPSPASRAVATAPPDPGCAPPPRPQHMADYRGDQPPSEMRGRGRAAQTVMTILPRPWPRSGAGSPRGSRAAGRSGRRPG